MNLFAERMNKSYRLVQSESLDDKQGSNKEEAWGNELKEGNTKELQFR
jgi:hypothetical protein